MHACKTMYIMRIFIDRSKPREYDSGLETLTMVGWPHLNVFWLSKGDSTRHSERKKQEEIDRSNGGRIILESGQRWT